MLISLELKRWIRGKRFYILILFFMFLAITSTLSSYYANDIIKNIATDTQGTLILPKPTWDSVLSSFYKNSSQMGIFVSLYIILSMSDISKTESLALFYKTRTTNKIKIFFPKLISSLIVLLLSLVAGIMVAIYMTVVLCGSIAIDKVLQSVVLHFLVSTIIVMIGFFLNVIINVPFVISGIFEIIILIISSLSNIKALNDFTGINLLLPKGVLANTPMKDVLFPSVWYLLIYLGITIILVMFVEIIKGKRYGY